MMPGHHRAWQVEWEEDEMENAIGRGLSPETRPVLLRVEGPVTMVILNRPVVHNCGNLQLIAASVDATEPVQSDETVRVVVLRGNGWSFSSGIDLKVASADAYDQLVGVPVTAQLYSKKMQNLAGEVPFDAKVLDVWNGSTSLSIPPTTPKPL